MNEAAGNTQIATAPPAVTLPPAPRIPKVVQGVAFIAARRWMIRQLARRYGSAFLLNLPVYGHTVVVADPRLAKQVFTTSPEDLGNIQP
ncbi:MAG TPA: cytochrome P450, partial [Mycobacterium sp.]|nr:cytochrome P450 [Mycobacterium sp.]